MALIARVHELDQLRLVNPDMFFRLCRMVHENDSRTLPSERRPGRICEDCLYGRHQLCGYDRCPCIHRAAA